MIQNNLIDLQCQNSEHERSYIIGSCLFPNCETMRPFCSACKKEFHGDHLHSLVKFDDFDILKKEKIVDLQEIQKHIEEIKKYIDSIIPILQSYQLHQRELNQLTISEIHTDSQKILQINFLNENFRLRIENLALDVMQLKKDLKQNSEMKLSPRKEIRNLNISAIKDAHHHQTSNSLSPSIYEQKRELYQSDSSFKRQISPSKKQHTQPDDEQKFGSQIQPKKSPFYGLKLLQLKVSPYKDQRILINNSVVYARETGGLIWKKIKYLINNFQSNVYFGICSKEIVKSYNYKPIFKNNQHGCFMMDQCGLAVSSNRNNDNNVKKGFAFSVGQIIQIEIKLYSKTITWTNLSTQKSFQMIFEPRCDQYPCALINYAQVEMITVQD